MLSNKSSISNSETPEEIGSYWDDHDLGEHWEQTRPVHFVVELGSTRNYYAIDEALSARLRALAQERGVSAETLLNLWVQEKTALVFGNVAPTVAVI